MTGLTLDGRFFLTLLLIASTCGNFLCRGANTPGPITDLYQLLKNLTGC